MNQNQTTAEEQFENWQDTIEKCLDRLEAGKVLKRRRLIIIKPNLVNDSPHPITTHPDMVQALVEYIRRHSKARLVIAEGCGSACLETAQVYAALGYDQLARDYGLDLIDLNQEPVQRLKNSHCSVLPEVYLPRAVLKGFLISVPVLKRHSLAEVTLSMKNMLGMAPPSHYQQGGSWKKSFFHNRMHRSIFELNLYRAPDLSIIDASVGMAEYHLGGPVCKPAVNRIIAGFDPVAVDAAGAGLLGLSWRDVAHIRMAHGVLGNAEGMGNK